MGTVFLKTFQYLRTALRRPSRPSQAWMHLLLQPPAQLTHFPPRPSSLASVLSLEQLPLPRKVVLNLGACGRVRVGGGVGEEIQPSRKQLAMSGDISGCHDSGQRERDLVGGGWGCCSTSYNAQGSPHRMNYLVPNIASAEAERPCPRMIAPPSGSQLTRHLLEKPFANCSLPLCPSHDTGHWFSSHRPSEL